MKIDINKWNLRKRKSYLRIWEDLEIGYLDRDLLPVLIVVNKDVELYTTSSCSGRIVIVDSEYPWTRDGSNVIFKSHIPVKESEVLEIYEMKPFRRLWLIVNGPIIHIYSRSVQKAVKIIQIARSAGFKHSGILGASKRRGVFIELISGIYMCQLLRTRDQLITRSDHIATLVEVYNSSLIDGKRRLSEFYKELTKVLPVDPDDFVINDLQSRGLIYERSPYEIYLELASISEAKKYIF